MKSRTVVKKKQRPSRLPAPAALSLSPFLAGLPVYQPGRPIEEVARELGLPAAEVIKLASNENPLGPSPKALAAMQAALPQLHLYPEIGRASCRERVFRTV